MRIYVLDWIKEDLKAKGEDLKDYSLLDLKDLLNEYKSKYLIGQELNYEEIKELLKKALDGYIKSLNTSDFKCFEYKTEALVYIKVLNDENLTVKYMDVNKAKELLNKVARGIIINKYKYQAIKNINLVLLFF